MSIPASLRAFEDFMAMQELDPAIFMTNQNLETYSSRA